MLMVHFDEWADQEIFFYYDYGLSRSQIIPHSQKNNNKKVIHSTGLFLEVDSSSAR